MNINNVASWKRDDFAYTSCYCEENIWKLCEKLKSNNSNVLDDSYAVFISNGERKVPLWMQRSGDERREYFVMWDYHVILAVKTTDARAFIVDFDTVLGFVVPFSNYLKVAIRRDEDLLDPFKRKFRIIPASLYLENFASDRSHMLREDGTGQKHYISPPPNYPVIASEVSTNNIEDFISMDGSRGIGRVVDYEGFAEFFSHKTITSVLESKQNVIINN